MSMVRSSLYLLWEMTCQFWGLWWRFWRQRFTVGFDDVFIHQYGEIIIYHHCIWYGRRRANFGCSCGTFWGNGICLIRPSCNRWSVQYGHLISWLSVYLVNMVIWSFGRNDHLVNVVIWSKWSSSLLFIWLSDHLFIWSFGHLVNIVFWSSGHMVIWSSGHLVIWSSGHLVNMVIWSSGHLGNMVIWSIWSSGQYGH